MTPAAVWRQCSAAAAASDISRYRRVTSTFVWCIDDKYCLPALSRYRSCCSSYRAASTAVLTERLNGKPCTCVVHTCTRKLRTFSSQCSRSVGKKLHTSTPPSTMMMKAGGRELMTRVDVIVSSWVSARWWAQRLQLAAVAESSSCSSRWPLVITIWWRQAVMLLLLSC